MITLTIFFCLQLFVRLQRRAFSPGGEPGGPAARLAAALRWPRPQQCFPGACT